ncbi:PH domain-containing protein [Nocardia sp. NPDC019395]|uniref:PH domain-containing protein n=1 Tax=Nocardia sp. NPDC019395 TaxID=3154686 RepID=UPI0033F8528A
MSSPHQSVPPPESSHISAAAEVTGGDTAPPGPTRVIRTTRLAFLSVVISALCVFFPIVGWPAGLFWLALIPIWAVVWILRTQTTVSPRGLDLRTMLSSRHIGWDRVRGVSIPKRGYVRAHLDDDTEVPLPAVSYDRLRDLVDASGGRIPDPFALPDSDAAAEPADEKTGTEPAGEKTGTESAGDDSGAADSRPTTADTDPESTSERE